MIKVVLFDFYGVFLPDAYSLWLENNGLERKGFYAEIIHQLDKNEITETGFMRALSDAIGREVTSNEIHGQNPMPDAGIVALARDLKRLYSVSLFSNASKRLRTRLQTLDLEGLFNTVIISSEIGYAKPSQEAFAVAIEKLDVPAGEIVFIDDSIANTTAAELSGMQSIHYTGIAALHEQLQSLKVI